MNIEIKKSRKTVNYKDAMDFLEKRLKLLKKKKSKELIWLLEHPSIYTAGKTYKDNEIIDKKINLIKTDRGGKITWHGPGQLICYFIIDLNKRNRDIRKFINIIEETLIMTLKRYEIDSFSDRKNIGIWIKDNKKIKKIGAIGIKIKNWIAYHGFSLNINNSLKAYNKIIPCGIIDREVTSLNEIKKQDYRNLKKDIIKNLIINLKN